MRAGAEARAIGLALRTRGVDARERGLGVRRERGAGGLAGRAARLGEGIGGPSLGRAPGELLGGLLRRRGALGEHATEIERDAVGEEAGGERAVDDGVHERRAVGVDAVDAVGAKDGALDRDRGVRVDERLHAVGDARGQSAARLDDGVVDGERVHASPIPKPATEDHPSTDAAPRRRSVRDLHATAYACRRSCASRSRAFSSAARSSALRP
jgi:hypothetical protein